MKTHVFVAIMCILLTACSGNISKSKVFTDSNLVHPSENSVVVSSNITNADLKTVTPNIPSPSIGKNQKIFLQTDEWMVTSQNDTTVLVYHTLDKGVHWLSSPLPLRPPLDKAIDYSKELFTSFDIGNSNWILITSSPAAGLMEKALFCSTDQGQSWQYIADVSRLDGYPTGISFRNSMDGWLSATNHGQTPVPLFRTTDGGKTWQVQKIDIPADYKYGNSYPPIFDLNDSTRGTMKIDLVGDNKRDSVTYSTRDGGNTWLN